MEVDIMFQAGGTTMGSKGRKNEKKPKQSKQKPQEKQAAAKK